MTMTTEEWHLALLSWLGLEKEDLCPACSGRGRCAYGSTSGWRGGAGGQMITADVCDRCWGTGDRNRKGADLRAMTGKLRSLDAALTAERAIADKLAAALRTLVDCDLQDLNAVRRHVAEPALAEHAEHVARRKGETP